MKIHTFVCLKQLLEPLRQLFRRAEELIYINKQAHEKSNEQFTISLHQSCKFG